ncbi:TetR/AcrR family transcriptional regulator [Chelatococcus sp. GCM10030263]|uniref:TetR/AcrR family transcriptional regulator n=1 Tax=Chelatococcus sp. GCM10030263 TaxID=3273387 RepID=UPI00360EC637
MKVSREQVAENRRRILEAAGRLFRERGFEAVTVADVMKAAGLTHGGFYGHFKSKDDLIAQTLASALTSSVPDEIDLAGFAAGYLSARHCNDLAGGCPTAGLGAETIRQAPEARAAMTAGLRRQIELLSPSAPGGSAAEKRRAAIGSWAAMVGAVILARMSDDPALSDEMLKETGAWIAAKSMRARPADA